MQGTYIAYLDRIVDGTDAVLLLEDEGKTVDQLIVDVKELPSECQYEGALIEVKVSDKTLVEATHRPERERKRRERIRNKTEGLRKRPEDLDRD